MGSLRQAWARTEEAPSLSAGEGPEQATGCASIRVIVSTAFIAWKDTGQGLAVLISLWLLGAAFLAGCRGGLLRLLLLADLFPGEQDTEVAPSIRLYPSLYPLS